MFMKGTENICNDFQIGVQTHNICEIQSKWKLHFIPLQHCI